ncbi:MAG: DUF4190 domain-containing protein [Thermoguttaceae bacterium]
MARKYEFDDALKGVYTDRDEVAPEQATDYRAIGVLSVGSLICGVLSILTFLSWSLVALPICGVVLGVLSLRKILHATEEVGGMTITSAGLGLSILCGGVGVGVLIYHQIHSVPAGYIRLDFDELALPRPGTVSEKLLHYAENRQPVFIQGYMYQTNKMSGIDHFMLVKSTEHCKSCAPTRNPAEMVEVMMTGDQRVAYRTRPVRVGGLLEIDPDRLRSGQSPYMIRADVFR